MEITTGDCESVIQCALCGALADRDPADHKGWREIDGDLYCPDCWHICDGKSCGHRPEDGERCAQPNEKPRLSIECLSIGIGRCPWMHPSVNADDEKGVVCVLPDEDGYACPRVQRAAETI